MAFGGSGILTSRQQHFFKADTICSHISGAKNAVCAESVHFLNLIKWGFALNLTKLRQRSLKYKSSKSENKKGCQYLSFDKALSPESLW